jgi:hypothetical protein
MPNESPVPLQADTLSQLPGGGVRTIVAVVMVNGVPTPVQMQVVTVADQNGVLLDAPRDDVLREMSNDLKDIRKLVAMLLGVPALEDHRGTGETMFGT